MRDSLKIYLRDRSTDCVIYAEDGSEFKIHKAIFGQTEFQRKILLCAKEQCCETLEIICPLPKDELCHLVNFFYSGQIKCDSKVDSLKILDNLSKVFGYPSQNMIVDDPNCNDFESLQDNESNDEVRKRN